MQQALPLAQLKAQMFSVSSEYILINEKILNKLCKKEGKLINDIIPLLDYLLNRIDTATHFTKRFNLVDAEIILRSATESFSKIFYVLYEEGNIEAKLNEFWLELAEIDSYRSSSNIRRI